MQVNDTIDETELPVFHDIKKIIDRDDCALLEEALSYYPQLIDIQNSNQRSLVHEAADAGSWGCLDTLKKLGADLNAKDIFLQTPLHRALGMHREDASIWLIVNGADLNAVDFYGNSPVLFAAEWRSDILEKIVECGGDAGTVDKLGRGIEDWAKMGAARAVMVAQAKKGIKT